MTTFENREVDLRERETVFRVVAAVPKCMCIVHRREQLYYWHLGISKLGRAAVVAVVHAVVVLVPKTRICQN